MPATKWEYELVKVAGDVKASLDQVGNDGWEVVTFMVAEEDGLVFLVKREKRLIELVADVPAAEAAAGLKLLT